MSDRYCEHGTKINDPCGECMTSAQRTAAPTADAALRETWGWFQCPPDHTEANATGTPPCAHCAIRVLFAALDAERRAREELEDAVREYERLTNLPPWECKPGATEAASERVCALAARIRAARAGSKP